MRYIRTKNRIIDRGYSELPFICKEEIINESDNLEDLLDGIETYDDKNGYIYVDYTMFGDKKDTTNKTEVLEGIIENMKDEEYTGKNQTVKTVKGYLRISTGLIYVAKLNDRNEWELL